MRIYLLISVISLLTLFSCAQTPPPEFQPEGTIRDVMQSMVAPKADSLWNAVATSVTEKGTEEIRPETDEDWDKLHQDAITLVEAMNVVQIPGRMVAKPGQQAQDPKVELPPEQIQTLIDADRASWTKFAHGMHDATMVALKAIEAKDADALSTAGDGIDKACENCHLTYWYPKKPAQP